MKKYIKVYLPIYIIELVIIGIIGYFLYPFGPLKILIGCGCLAVFCLLWCIKASYNRYNCDKLRIQFLAFSYLDDILYHLTTLVYSNNQDLDKINYLVSKFNEIIEFYKKNYNKNNSSIILYQEKLDVILDYLYNYKPIEPEEELDYDED